MSIFEQLADSLRSRKLQAVSGYRELVNTLASDGKPPKTEAVEMTLRDAGKSVGDLESDVTLAKRRNGLRSQIAESERLLKERPGIDAEIAKIKAALQKAQDVHDAALAPLRQRIQAIETAIHQASLASMELQSTAPDDERQAERKRAVRDAAAEKNAAQKHLAAVESRLQSARLEIPVDGETITEYERQRANAEQRLEASREAAEAAVASQDALLVELAAS